MKYKKCFRKSLWVGHKGEKKNTSWKCMEADIIISKNGKIFLIRDMVGDKKQKTRVNIKDIKKLEDRVFKIKWCKLKNSIS